MREHLESLIGAVGEALGRSERRGPAAEPRRRRPRAARSTYVPVRREPASAR